MALNSRLVVALNDVLQTEHDTPHAAATFQCIASGDYWCEQVRALDSNPDLLDDFIKGFETEFKVPYDPEHHYIKIMKRQAMYDTSIMTTVSEISDRLFDTEREYCKPENAEKLDNLQKARKELTPMSFIYRWKTRAV